MCVFVCVCVKFEENESVKFVFERVDTVHTTVHSLQRRSCDVCLRGLNSIEARGVLFQRLSSSIVFVTYVVLATRLLGKSVSANHLM